MKDYLSVMILEQDGVCLDGSVELSMSCMCKGNPHKCRDRHDPAHNADVEAYNVSGVLISFYMDFHSLCISTWTTEET